MPDVLLRGLRLLMQDGLSLVLRLGLGPAASGRRPRPRLCYRVLPSLHLGELAGLVGLDLVLRDPPRLMHRLQLRRQAHRHVANLFCDPWRAASHLLTAATLETEVEGWHRRTPAPSLPHLLVAVVERVRVILVLLCRS